MAQLTWAFRAAQAEQASVSLPPALWWAIGICIVIAVATACVAPDKGRRDSALKVLKTLVPAPRRGEGDEDEDEADVQDGSSGVEDMTENAETTTTTPPQTVTRTTSGSGNKPKRPKKNTGNVKP